MLIRFIIYAFRWQLSTPILAPVLILTVGMFSENETTNFWIATALANFIGASIFFWVDRIIFKARMRNPLWEVKDDFSCALCGKKGRCYRLFKARNYDRTDDKNPIFLCEDCSRQKVEQLKNRGIKI